jgi:hypothetical protein
MDPATIQQIAAEVVARLPYGNRYWLVFVVNAVVAALIGAITVLGTSYLRTRAQNLATKHDFDELRKQLKANTELVETIKAEVGQRDWAQREWTNLRRIKLEALFDKMHECDAELERRHLAVVQGSPLKEERDYINEFVNPLQTISTLYLPEVSIQTGEFYTCCLRGHFAIVGLDQALRDAGDDSAARQRAYDDFNTMWKPEERLSARYALEEAARTFLERIMGIEEGSRDNRSDVPTETH